MLLIDPATGWRRVLHAAPLTVAVDVTPDGGRLLVRRSPRGARDLLVVDVGGALTPVLARREGGSSDDRELLRDLSPLHAIDRLRAPLLLVHGADDTNVPVAESQQVAAALVARGAPHRLLIFPGEGHELLDAANRVVFVQAVLDWVRSYLT